MARSTTKKGGAGGKVALALDKLIEEIIVDAYGDDEQLWAFREAFEQQVGVPCDARLVGEPVSITVFDYDGNPRRGLIAKCRRPDGSKRVITLADVVFSPQSVGERYLAAYRKWLGVKPFVPRVDL